MGVVTRASVNRPLTFAEMDENLTSAYAHYGQRAITNNTTAIAIPAAVDPTLFTTSDYVQIVGIWDAAPSGENNGITQQDNSLTIERAAIYQPQLWASVSSDQANTNVAVRFSVDGVIQLQRRPRVKIGTGGDRVNLAAHGIASLPAGAVIGLWVASDKAANILFEDGVFSLVELRTL